MNNNKKINDLFDNLRSISWFSQCGKSANQWETARSWPTACKLLADARWQNFTLELINRYREILWSKIPISEIRSFEDAWNDRADVVDNQIDAFCVEELWSRLPFEDAKSFNLTVRKELRCMAMEADNSEILPPVFFQPLLLPVYKAGHLPCGWSGVAMPQNWRGNSLADLPSGRLIVF